MKFQDIDFHVELFKAYLEPPSTRVDYLLMLRKQVKPKINKNVFIIKLRDAFDNIKKVWERDFFSLCCTHNIDENTPFFQPASSYRMCPKLEKLLESNSIRICKTDLEELDLLIDSFELYLKLREFTKDLNNLGIDSPNKNLDQSTLSGNVKDSNVIKRFIIDKEIIEPLHNGLKQYFEGKEDDLLNLLKGEKILEKLIWPLNQNQLNDLIKRLITAKKISHNFTECTEWICMNFNQKNEKPFNKNTVYDALTGKTECTKKMRILTDLNF